MPEALPPPAAWVTFVRIVAWLCFGGAVVALYTDRYGILLFLLFVGFPTAGIGLLVGRKIIDTRK